MIPTRTLEFARYIRPGDGYHISRSHIVKSRPFPLHSHDFVELFWLEAGEGIHLVNGESLPVRKGDIVFMRDWDAHSLTSTTAEGMRVANAAFPVSTLNYLRSRYSIPLSDYWDESSPLPATIRVSSMVLAWLSSEADWLAEDGRTLLHIDRFLLTLFAKLKRNRPTAEEEKVPAWLRGPLQAIREPKHFRIGPIILARLAGRTSEHVARVLKETVGLRPTDLVNRARMEHAAQRLIMSDEEILTISEECGFESLGHFYQCFAKYHGNSPRRFRMHQRGVLGLI